MVENYRPWSIVRNSSILVQLLYLTLAFVQSAGKSFGQATTQSRRDLHRIFTLVNGLAKNYLFYLPGRE